MKVKTQYSQNITIMHPEAELKRNYKSTCFYRLMNGHYREEMLLFPHMEKIAEMNSVCHGVCDEYRHFKKVVEYGSVFRPVEYQSKVTLNERVPEHRFESMVKQDKGYRHYRAGVERGEEAPLVENGLDDDIVDNWIEEEQEVDTGPNVKNMFIVLKPHKPMEFDDKVSFISRLDVDVDEDETPKENGDILNGDAAEYQFQF